MRLLPTGVENGKPYAGGLAWKLLCLMTIRLGFSPPKRLTKADCYDPVRFWPLFSAASSWFISEKSSHERKTAWCMDLCLMPWPRWFLDGLSLCWANMVSTTLKGSA